MEKTILQINEFLKEHNWCDFEIISLQRDLLIGGKTGFSEEHDIQITFEDVFFMQCLSEWKTNTLSYAFSIPSIEEQREININFSIIQGNKLFKILAEDLNNAMYISAKNIKCVIINKG
jgi:hypothetical protein